MKRKRVGAGQRGSSNPFQTAQELLKTSTGQFECEPLTDISENSSALESSVTSSIRARANAASASSLNSPTKKGKALSKKQQKLADAAKTSRTISQYFTKKETKCEKATESTLFKRSKGDMSPPRSPVLEEDVEKSPMEVENHAVITIDTDDEDVMLVPEEEEEEERHQEITEPCVTSDPEQIKLEEVVNPPPTLEATPTHEITTKRAPPAKRRRPAEGSRRVTFNPHVEEKVKFNPHVEEKVTFNHDVEEKVTFNPDLKRKINLNPGVEEKAVLPVTEPKAVTLKEAADIVVRCLDPFYSQGRFSTKDLFKSFARFLSHLLTEGTTKGKEQIKAEAKALIKKFFSKIQRCESEADWKHLKRPQRCKTVDNKV